MGTFYFTHFSDNNDPTVTRDPRQNVAYLGDKPSSLQALVKDADLVVVGKIGEVVKQANETGLSGPPPPRTNGTAPPYVGLPFTYYSVKVEQVVGGTGAKPGDTITLRVNGSTKFVEQVGGDMLMPRRDQRLLLVLDTHPSIDGYFPVPFGIFDISGAEATYYNVDKTSVRKMTDRAALADFVGELRNAMAARSGQQGQ